MQNMQKVDIPLHDIKPLVDIQEYSIYYFSAIVVVLSILLVAFLYLAYRWIKHRNRFNIRKEHNKLLQEVDLNDAKKAAYDLTFYGATFKDDSLRHLKTYEDLIEKLESYKYKKNVESFDSETLRIIELYRGMIDV
ncbi:hypothetical protein [Sulfurimonas sp.]